MLCFSECREYELYLDNILSGNTLSKNISTVGMDVLMTLKRRGEGFSLSKLVQ